MRQIQPIQIWNNGQTKEASILLARIIHDNLNTSCTFYYELKEADIVTQPEEEWVLPYTTPGAKLAEGNVTMTGQDYLDWDGSNETAYAFISNKINVIIN